MGVPLTDQQKAAVKKKTKVRTGRRTADSYDYNLLAAGMLLVCFGLVMLYCTSSYEAQLKFEGNDMYYFTRQAVISAAAILLAVLVSRLDYHLLIPVSGLAYVGSLVLMAMVKYTPLGVSAYGARRWLNLGIQFQPSEVAKIAVIIYLPVVIINDGRVLTHNLHSRGLDDTWLDRQLKAHHVRRSSDVFLLTVDEQNQVYLAEKEGKQ